VLKSLFYFKTLQRQLQLWSNWIQNYAGSNCRVDHRCFSRAWAWHKIWRLAWLRFVIIATVTLHRYWGYPQAAQLVQYTFLVKNLAAAGGLILLFATGAGRFSLDNKMAS